MLINFYNLSVLLSDRDLLRIEPIQYTRSNHQVDKSKSEEQKHVISGTIWEEIKQRELNILEQERKIQEVVFSRIYQRDTGEMVLITSL